MSIQEFERLLQQFAREAEQSPAVQIDADWQRLADRLASLHAPCAATCPCQPFVNKTFSQDRFTVN